MPDSTTSPFTTTIEVAIEVGQLLFRLDQFYESVPQSNERVRHLIREERKKVVALQDYCCDFIVRNFIVC